MLHSLLSRPGRARHPALAVLSAVALLASAPASAAIVSGVLDFSAAGFGAGAPHDPVTGRVAFSFDNTAGFFNKANGDSANGAPVQVQIISVSLPGTWVPVLSYFTTFNGQPADFFSIGHAPTTFVGAGTDDWRVAFNGTQGTPTFRELTYATSQVSSQFFQSFRGQAAPVPEPASWALLGLGLALPAGLRRRGVAVRTAQQGQVRDVGA